MFSKIFLIASKIGESLGSFQEYPDKLMSEQGDTFLIVTLVKDWQYY
jgi:hypothetical protein